jgi:hypothetical protein
MSDTTSLSTVSSADIAADIIRLIAPSDRPGFDAMLQHELRGREPQRKIIEDTWRTFCVGGWIRKA